MSRRNSSKAFSPLSDTEELRTACSSAATSDGE
jgi:hypothetical protein